MNFDLTNSFEDNLAIFRTEAQAVDPECAKILFDNLPILCGGEDISQDREAIADFHRAVLAALETLPNATKDGAKS